LKGLLPEVERAAAVVEVIMPPEPNIVNLELVVMVLVLVLQLMQLQISEVAAVVVREIMLMVRMEVLE
jgi:hypothetical protein